MLYYVEEGLYYPCSENIGADQLRGFRPCILLVFLCGGSNEN